MLFVEYYSRKGSQSKSSYRVRNVSLLHFQPHVLPHMFILRIF